MSDAEKLAQVTHERDCLAEAIRNAAVAAGIVNPDADIAGPMLLVLCDDLATMAKRKAAAF